eukprot:1195269-Prymnesium_polylepis.3
MPVDLQRAMQHANAFCYDKTVNKTRRGFHDHFCEWCEDGTKPLAPVVSPPDGDCGLWSRC